MLNPFTKASMVDLTILVMLVGFTSFLLLNLRFIQKEVDEIRAERRFLTLKLQEIKKNREYLEKKLGNILIAADVLSGNFREKVSDVRMIKATAYSSTPDQTDDTPFVTASGAFVRDGIVANNLLPFGTKIRLPEAFGEKMFVVEDRMKRDDLVDIWFPTREEALAFGVRNLKMEILSN